MFVIKHKKYAMRHTVFSVLNVAGEIYDLFLIYTHGKWLWVRSNDWEPVDNVDEE